ncbi:ABC transporter permease [Marinoscillum sp. MHG1-6]|uniref:ABC transporter permease n=1 Tax=Marinoscillum sp. MHG1-6 TaxID=2959627 RepID=UPI0021577BB9|nr:FtsX-like permease family protein [Marinoscillum sp. MHG1-6]
MNLPLFISKRISDRKDGSFSGLISRIAVVSMSVALVALLMAFAILGGFEKNIKNKIYSFGGHLIVSKYTLSTSFEESSISIADSVMKPIVEMPGLDYYTSYIYKAGLLKANEEVQGVIVKGVDSNFDTVSFAENMVEGSFPKFPETGYGLEIALSKKIANYLKLSVGDDLIIFFFQNPPRMRKLKVSGIYETGLEDFDEKTIIGDINLLRRINGWSEDVAGGVEVFMQDDSDLEAAESYLFDETSSDLYVDKVSDKYAQIFDWLRLLDRNVVIFLVLILFVACFNMVSILLILIMERTQMIGTLSALGADGKLLRRIFYFNGVRLIGKGLFWGNLIGLGLCWLQYQFQIIPLDPANYYMDHVPILFAPKTILLVNVMTVLLTGLTLFIPLSVISRIRPIAAIRFD